LKRRVVITGLGVIASNGIGKEAFWDALVNGRSGIGRITRFDASTYPSQIAGEVNGFDPTDYMSPKTAKRIDRFSQFGVAAVSMAVEDARLKIEEEDPDRIGVIVGSSVGGMPDAETQHTIFMEKGLRRVSPLLGTRLFPGSISNLIAIELGVHGFGATISSGCATGVDAIGYAFEAISMGKADLIITGAAETPLAPLTFGSLCLTGVMSTKNDTPIKVPCPFDKKRDGIVLGEGAGIVILEELEHALARERTIYAEVLGYGTTYDGYHITQPMPTGEHASKAIKLALKEADLRPEDIDYINAHGCGTPLSDQIETLAIKKVFGDHAYKLSVSSIEPMIGHPFGAAAAIEIIACALVLKNQILPPTINYEDPDPECDLDYIPNKAREGNVRVLISNSLSFGGKNSVLVLKQVN